MLILFLKSAPDSDNQMPLHDKLVLIFEQRVKEAKTDKDKARAQRDLAKLTSKPSEDQRSVT